MAIGKIINHAGSTHFMDLVRYIDASREQGHDRQSAAGTLDNAIEKRRARGGLVVDMKNDRKVVHAFEKT